MASANKQDSPINVDQQRTSGHDPATIMVAVVILAIIIITFLTITAIWNGPPAV